MNYIKRYFEDISTAITDAVFSECFDLADIQGMSRSEVNEENLRMLSNGQGFYIYAFLVNAVTQDGQHLKRADMPMTFKAMDMLRPFVEWEKEQ